MNRRATAVQAPTPVMRDQDLRAAVRASIDKAHAGANALVVEELGLLQGSRRIDIAVATDRLYGYELKSEADRLDRLPGQVEVYSRVMDRATLVTTEGHLAAAMPYLPPWWGVQIASRGQDAQIVIDTVRTGADNPSPDPFHVAQLLWRSEAMALAEALNTGRDLRRMNKASLFEMLAEHLPLSVLRGQVIAKMKARTSWRQPLVGPPFPGTVAMI